MNHNSHHDWDKLSAALRREGVADHPEHDELSAPHGFATRVVARFQADERANAAGVSLWRRWCLTGAACAMVLLGGTFFLEPEEVPTKPIIPIPTLDSEAPNLAKR